MFFDERELSLPLAKRNNYTAHEVLQMKPLINKGSNVFEIKPRNDPHTNRGRNTVDPEQRISARIGCDVDSTTVNDTTFHVESSDGLTVECTLATESHSYGSRIICAHDPLEANTVYTLTISGIACEDGQLVAEATSSFLTESEDDDEGSPEDELDDASSSDDDD